MMIFLWLLSHAVCLLIGWCGALIWPGMRSDEDDHQGDDDDLPKVVDWAKFDAQLEPNNFGPGPLIKEWAVKDAKDREDAKS